MRKKLNLLGVGLVSLILAGCSTRMIDFTAISSKNCNVTGTRGERVQGRDMVWSILFFPTGTPNLKAAVDRAIEKGGGDILVDGVVYVKGWSALLFGKMGYVVEGTVVNTRR